MGEPQNETSPWAAEYSKGLKSFLPRLCVAIVLGGILLIFGEGLAYFALRHTQLEQGEISSPPASIYRERSWAQTLWRERQSSAARLQYRAYVVWRRAPFHGETVNIDTEGIRRTHYSDCGSGTYTIWMFGNSNLWGMGSPDWGTIPSLLAQQYKKNGRTVCVKNYAESAWVSTQELVQLLLALKASDRKPDLVIFYDGVPDSFLSYESDEGDVHGNFQRIKARFEEAQTSQRPGFEYVRKTNSYRLLTSISAELQNGEPGNQRRAISAQEAGAKGRKTVENYLKNIDLMETLGRQFGFRCAFFWQPNAIVGPKPFTPEEEKIRTAFEQRNPGVELVFNSTYEGARAIRRPDFFFLGDIFSDRAETTYLDLSHVSPEGDSMLAETMYRLLQAKATPPQVLAQ